MYRFEPGRRAGAGRIASLLAMLACSCAGFEQERHLAPIFTHVSRAGGDREIEAFGGAVLLRHDGETGALRYFALRPLLSHERARTERSRSTFLAPLGSATMTPEEDVYQFLPLARYSRKYHPDAPTTWTFFSLPGIYWSKNNDGRIRRALFPLGGQVEDFLSMDHAVFALWPLYTRLERNGRTTYHVLFPFFSWSSGSGGNAWRIWPLVGVNRWDDRYERWFFLWPFFHWQVNGLGKQRTEPQESTMFWPLFGSSSRGSSSSWTALWPFFGYRSNPENGFWAWDGPWPLVMFQEPGETGQARRKRVWPLFSYFEGDGMTSRYFLWPFYNTRTERYDEATKETTNLLPFYQAWNRRDPEHGDSSWRKVFPLFRSYRAEENDERFVAFPALNPLTWRLGFIDEQYAWMWELYARYRRGEELSERSILGLYRRERDADEDRRSLVGLYARRDYRRSGLAVRETSLLFGLLRWRESSEGVTMLRPAFPGPGWPLERVPSKLMPTDGAGPSGEGQENAQ